MQINHSGIEILIVRFLKGELSLEERKKLDAWLDIPSNKKLFERICKRERIVESSLQFDLYNRNAAWERFEKRIYGKTRIVRWKWISIAACFLPLLIGIGLLYRAKNEKVISAGGERMITPAVSRARMQLPTGETIGLDNDTISSFHFLTGEMKRDSSGMLVFSPASATSEKTGYYQVTTPRGSEFKMVLADGTTVWMNAGSSLRFPQFFTGKCREVYVRGELYFEVARDDENPFVVSMEGGYKVKVLGTEFNIRSYDGEQCRTTLIRGKVSIENDSVQTILLPGQQAIQRKGQQCVEVEEVNVSEVVAWRRGVFLFDNTRLEDIMEELGRWYDVEVFFENQAIRDERFSVDIRRYSTIEEVLQLIESTNTVKMVVKERAVFVK